MKREDLEKQGLTKEQIDFIMTENGKDIEKHKTDHATEKQRADGLQTQLTEANKQIDDFKKLDVDGVRKAADEYKNKFEQAQKDSAVQLSQLKFDHALDGLLTGAKAKNVKAVRALLDTTNLKFNETDGSIIGLDEQLKKVREANDYLFEPEEGTPRIVAGGTNQNLDTNSFLAAARKGAGLPE